MRRIVRAALVLAFALFASSAARADLLPPGQFINGSTQAQLTAVWWQTMLGIPAASNPLLDSTGKYASLGSQGSVFFLAGSLGSGDTPISRTATVYSNQALFFPIVGNVSFPANSLYSSTEAGLRQDAAAGMGITSQGTLDPKSNTSLFLTLSQGSTPLVSESTSTLLFFRQTSPPGLFPITLPAGDLTGAGPTTTQGVTDGWWAALGPLAPGTYTLHFGGQTTGTDKYAPAFPGDLSTTTFQDITYTLNVQAAPEPSTLALAGTAGLIFLGGVRRWRLVR